MSPPFLDRVARIAENLRVIRALSATPKSSPLELLVGALGDALMAQAVEPTLPQQELRVTRGTRRTVIEVHGMVDLQTLARTLARQYPELLTVSERA